MSLEKPNYTQLPNCLLDGLPEFSGAELKVLLSMCRQTFGYHREKTTMMSVSFICAAVGLSHQAVINATKTLLEKQLIYRHARGQSFTYELNLDPLTGIPAPDSACHFTRQADFSPCHFIRQTPVTLSDRQGLSPVTLSDRKKEIEESKEKERKACLPMPEEESASKEASKLQESLLPLDTPNGWANRIEDQVIKEIIKPTSTKSDAALQVEIPAVLNTEAFKAVWVQWIADRKQRRKPMTVRAAELQLRDIVKWGIGVKEVIKAIEKAISNGWLQAYKPTTQETNGKNWNNPKRASGQLF